MHCRNVFNKPPDYTILAIKHPEFRKVCKLVSTESHFNCFTYVAYFIIGEVVHKNSFPSIDIIIILLNGKELNGKVTINYKNESALRALTQMLLLEYFNLNVEFALGSLVPTLPLRLNYVLWLEDILGYPNCETIRGIDIGCGSSCIYSLLSAKKNNWFMVALESHSSNLEYAKRNIERNDLSAYIELFPQSSKKQIFQEYFSSKNLSPQNSPYDFCICNPPFYDSQSTISHTRNPAKRPPPHNCPTGNRDELFCQGGEVKFVEQIIEESLQFKEHIRIFTSMLGHKSSLTQILHILETNNIDNFCCTEFHQGNTTRWGIAWSHFTDIELKKKLK